MKRYIMFGYNEGEKRGGTRDFIGEGDTLEDCTPATPWDIAEVLDTADGSVYQYEGGRWERIKYIYDNDFVTKSNEDGLASKNGKEVR